MLTALTQPILDLLFPRLCVTCQKEGKWLCRDCRNRVGGAGLYTHPEFAGLFGLLSFRQKAVRELLHTLKYNGVYEVVGNMLEVLQWQYSAEMLIEELGEGQPLLLVPVPLGKGRAKQRGYNQAELLTRELAAWLGCSVWLGLRREDNATTQVGKGASERQEGKQFVVNGVPPEEFAAHQIVVVDDVLTTGATLRQCQEVLKGATGKSVRGLAIAYQL